MLSRTTFLVLLLSAIAARGAEPPLTQTPSLRGPTSLAVADGSLWVGNAASGTLSQLTIEESKVKGEFRYGPGLSAVYPHPTSGLWVLDSHRHALVHVNTTRPSKRTVVAEVARYPIRLAYLPTKRTVVVASRWSHALTTITLDDSVSKATSIQRIELDFAPRELLVLDEARSLALVADAFGGKLAVVDLAAQSLRHQFDLPGQNIRGLALSAKGDEVVFTHQLLDPKIWGERDSVHWGLLIANSLRGVRLSDLLDPQADLMRTSWLDAIGAVGEGAGDPGAVVIEKGRTVVAISGVNQVLVDASAYRQRFPVGRRPAALAIANDKLFVANRFDDSVTTIDLIRGKVTGTTKLGPRRKLSDAERGEQLFFDARLSLAGWMSCHSCHADGHSTGKLADTLGDGDYGASKRILSLLGVRETGPWGWTASAKSLPEQVRKSVRTTMHGRPLREQQVKELVAYIEQLQPPSAPPVKDAALVRRGRAVFMKQNCADCHTQPLYTSPESYDVALTDAAGNRKFNPPSLRGLRQRSRFFHDGRFDHLRDVFRKARHQLDSPLSAEDEKALLAFLLSL